MNISPANNHTKVTTHGCLEVNHIVGPDDVQGLVATDSTASNGVERVYVVYDKTTHDPCLRLHAPNER